MAISAVHKGLLMSKWASVFIVSVSVSIRIFAGPQNQVDATFKFLESISRLTDVKQLEALAGRTDEELAGERPMNMVAAAGATTRINAYARLGELGTPESLAAARRIEAAAKQWSTAQETVSRGVFLHPAWHMGTVSLSPIAETTGGDGVHYGIIVTSYLGSWDAYLVSDRPPADKHSWTRPKLIPRPIAWHVNEPRLTWQAGDRLVFTYKDEKLGPQRWELSIADIERDSDHDGWTDYEEARLGLDAHNPDSDGDGLPDGRDPAPAYKPPAAAADADATNDRITVLQKAFFTAFGLTHARHALFVRSTSPKFQPWGYQGPILFDHDIPDFKSGKAPEGVYVDWKITKMTEDEAVVALSDYEGPLAAGGQEVVLHKYGAEWFVTKRQTTWIS
jgi:hypothetical protein